MIIHTYYQPVPGMNPPTGMLDLWASSWKRLGWDTAVLSEGDARKHPGFTYYQERISRHPNINPPGYERACFMRHLAMAQADGGWLSDYDVINYAFGPEDAKALIGKDSGMTVLEATKVPCVLHGDATAWEDLCDSLCEYQVKPTDRVNGRPHVSDMTIIRQLPLATKPACVECLCSGRPIPDDLGDGWKTSPLVHYSTYAFSKMGKSGKLKAKFIPTLRPLP